MLTLQFMMWRSFEPAKLILVHLVQQENLLFTCWNLLQFLHCLLLCFFLSFTNQWNIPCVILALAYAGVGTSKWNYLHFDNISKQTFYVHFSRTVLLLYQAHGVLHVQFVNATIISSYFGCIIFYYYNLVFLGFINCRWSEESIIINLISKICRDWKNLCLGGTLGPEIGNLVHIKAM